MKRWLACALVLAAIPVASAPSQGEARTDVVVAALGLLGTPYRSGGASPETGFDCSGLVWHVFKLARGLELPRRSEDMSRVGQPVDRADLQPGDLVFFNTLRRAFSHVAIYTGEGRFVHAPAGGGRVRIETLSERYWQSRYNGARRLTGRHDAPAVPARSAPAFMEDMDNVRP